MVLLAHRAFIQTNTGKSPFLLMCGRHPRLPVGQEVKLCLAARLSPEELGEQTLIDCLTSLRIKMSATVSWEHFLPAIRVPSSEDKIFKDECPFHFETAESGDGLYVCLKHFIGVGASALRKYAASADSRVFLQYKIKRTFKNRDPSSEPHPTKLALGVPGGFDLPQDRYSVTEQWALVLLPQGERVEIPCPSEGSPLADISHLVPLGMPERLAKAVSIVQHAESALLLEERARNVEAWEDENIRPISSHSLELKQLDNGVRIAPSYVNCFSTDPSSEPHPTKLALGVPGGFDLPQDRYSVTEQWALVLLPQGERVEIPCPSEGSLLADISHLVPLGMPERLAKAVSIVQHAESALLLEERARNVEAWEDENIRPISSHSLELKQLDNGVRIAPSYVGHYS
ncbi:hypothetical protein T265_11122 [Opisthorchis viverrini]|uniref:Ubiquitinyl hydrolase variant UBP zinc finger domain-containing protein n=1 Tax=Opisthorchis viverrini TaxID=6198 RepID=A0A074ZAQ8_OPIVI|nr:hypothetical protein T265_11122 [Opisthorchis viverrini]KER20315.1 hypothetical protein T265_11122 [Opisthorchis viverrini]